jgi:tRNA (cytidine/uridine-2'-O-)-methyltransferase
MPRPITHNLNGEEILRRIFKFATSIHIRYIRVHLSFPTTPRRMSTSAVHIVLVEPEIPPNTGSIARLCGATDTILDLVHPLGFKVDNKHLKRAGLDYWPHVQINHWENLEAFLRQQADHSLYFLTTKTTRSYTEVRFKPGDMLIFGKETKGLPEDILTLYSDRCLTIPMSNSNIRSLNLAMAAGIVLYEALRQIRR